MVGILKGEKEKKGAKERETKNNQEGYGEGGMSEFAEIPGQETGQVHLGFTGC